MDGGRFEDRRDGHPDAQLQFLTRGPRDEGEEREARIQIHARQRAAGLHRHDTGAQAIAGAPPLAAALQSGEPVGSSIDI